MREWVELPKPLPAGIVRAWAAVENGQSLCGIFQLVTGGQFMLCYHVMGQQPTVVRGIASIDDAMLRAQAVMDNNTMVPRPAPVVAT